jgi:choline dehydrogenase
MVSGIGDSKVLKDSKVECLVDIPGVGKNLQDHPALGIMFEAKEMLLDRYPSAYKVAQDLETYKLNVMRTLEIDFPAGTSLHDDMNAGEPVPEWSSPYGLFASTGLTSGAFLLSGLSNTTVPDIQLTVFPQITEPHIQILNHTRPVNPDVPAILITIALLDPDGRRNVCLSETNPVQNSPYIGKDSSVPVLSDLDIDRLVWAVTKVQEIQKQAPLQSVTGQNLTPGLNENMTHEELREWVKGHVFNNSHWCGTAKMGNISTDPTAVVDEKLRVKHVNNLHVMDASIIPLIPNGNVHSTIVFIASRGADLITESIS